MRNVLDQFNQNIERIKTLHSLHSTFKSQVTSLIDVSDMLRAEVVLLVSAVDYYIHEVVRIGMLEIFSGNRPETISYMNYNISLKAIREAIIDSENYDWLEREIIQKHSWKSFQQADKINEAIRLITDKNIWQAAATTLGGDEKSIKTRLNLVVDRRNKIAHEADMDPSSPGMRWPVEEQSVYEAIEFIKGFINSLHACITEP